MGEEFVCPWADFGAALGKGFLWGILAGLVALLIAKRFGLTRREGPGRRFLAGSYWFFVPLLCGGALSVWLFFSTIVDELEGSLEPLRSEIGAVSAEMADDAWIAATKGEAGTPEEFQARLKAEVLHQVDVEFLEGVLGSPAMPDIVIVFADALSSKFGELVYAQMMRLLTAKAADAVSLPPERLAPLWQDGVMTALRQGLLVDLFLDTVRIPLRGIRFNILLVAGIPLALIALETAQAAYARRRKRVAPGSGPTPEQPA